MNEKSFILAANDVRYFHRSIRLNSKEHAFRKKVDRIQIDDYIIEYIEIDFNDFVYDDISGLFGLDILMNAGFNIDLLKLQLNKIN